MSNFKTYSRTAIGTHRAGKVVAELVRQSRWFSTEPQPDDCYLITVKEESKSLLDDALLAVEMNPFVSGYIVVVDDETTDDEILGPFETAKEACDKAEVIHYDCHVCAIIPLTYLRRMARQRLGLIEACTDAVSTL